MIYRDGMFRMVFSSTKCFTRLLRLMATCLHRLFPMASHFRECSKMRETLIVICLLEHSETRKKVVKFVVSLLSYFRIVSLFLSLLQVRPAPVSHSCFPHGVAHDSLFESCAHARCSTMVSSDQVLRVWSMFDR